MHKCLCYLNNIIFFCLFLKPLAAGEIYDDLSKFYQSVNADQQKTDSFLLDSMGFTKLHKEKVIGQGIKILVIDTPVYTQHPSFDSSVKENHQFYSGDKFNTDTGDSTHGTIVTSIIKSQKDVLGAAFGADVLAVGIEIDEFNRNKKDLSELCNIIEEYKPNIISISASIQHFLNDKEGFKKFKDLIIKNDSILVLAAGNGAGAFHFDPKNKNKLLQATRDMDDLTDIFFDHDLIKRVVFVGAATHKSLLDPLEYFIDNQSNMVHKFWFRQYDPHPEALKRAKAFKKFERLEETFEEINNKLVKNNKTWRNLFEVNSSSFDEASKSIEENKVEDNYLLAFRNLYNENITNNLDTLFEKTNILGALPRYYPTFNQVRIDEFKIPPGKGSYYPNFIKEFVSRMDLLPFHHTSDYYFFPQSNRAGILKEHFIVAPSDRVRALSFEIKDEQAKPIIVHEGASTSLSVPFVTSAIALILSKYPNISGLEAIGILYKFALKTPSSQKNLEADEVFGQGILDLNHLP